MKYFLDTEFLEGTQKKLFDKSKPTIDLISVGIVAEDDREYYAISKDFNLKEAWNRYDKIVNKQYPLGQEYNKVYWIRDNVLKPIWKELFYLNAHQQLDHHYVPFNRDIIEVDKLYSKSNFTYKSFKKLIKKYGKTNKQIAEEVCEFCKGKINERNDGFREFVYSKDDVNKENPLPAYGYFENRSNPEFYGYYSDYDWVVFCWLFGKMIDLPKGFPKYCIDLNQTLNEKANKYVDDNLKEPIVSSDWHSNYCINELKILPNYPKETNKHNALADAKWHFELYKFLKTL